MKVQASVVVIGVLFLSGSIPAPAQAPSSAPASAITYAYTPLELDKCPHTRGRGPEDYGTWTCKGLDEIVVWVSGGDQRVTVSFGPRGRQEPAARQTLPAFNSEGKLIEWRLRDDKPFATILRWNTTKSADDGTQAKGQVLVVTRLPPGPVCHVGYVDGRANRNANELARQIADEHADGFRCGRDKPFILGQTGPAFSTPRSTD